MWPRFQDTLERRQLYDKMIIDCAFKQDLKRRIEPNLKGGCDEFYFSLTTNGLCYTFNGKNQRDLWEPSEALDVLMENYPQGEADKNFGGSGAVQGKIKRYKNLLQSNNITKYTIEIPNDSGKFRNG